MMKKVVLAKISDTLAGLFNSPLVDDQYIPLPSSLSNILITRARLILRPEGVFVGYSISGDGIDAEIPLEEIYPNWRKAVSRRLIDFVRGLDIPEEKKETVESLLLREWKR